MILVLSACSGVTPSPTLPSIPATGSTSVPTAGQAATSSPLPSDTATSPASQPTPTIAPPVNTPAPGSNPGSGSYIDDRSTPSQILVSYYNAINRHEYSRAYDYYSTPSATLGSFTNFANGYADTVSVDFVFGSISGDTSMSQTYFTVPVILKAVTQNSVHTNFAACYIVHQANPSVFGGPNFQPMSINSGTAKVMAAGAVDSAALATACTGQPTGPNPVSVSTESMDISKNNFIDNRSGPIETVSSLLNAINLKQFSRAYFYFETPATFPGPFDAYAAGYANTDSITATFGIIQTEGAAGSTYYTVPVGMKVLSTSNTTQTFVGCYTLRLAQPANQTVPPFHPLSIVSGKFSQVDNSADINSLLPTACQ
jgi:hypothetical protein